MDAPVCIIDESGITRPDYDEILTWLQEQYRLIYGPDIYIEPDSQDGQFLAILALAYSQACDMTVQVHNSFSPGQARGVGLSLLVKLNGIERKIASRSTATLRVVGQAGTVITSGIAVDTSGNQWLMPASVTIPDSGEIAVSAECATLGAIQAPAGTITVIGTPTRGWQSVENEAAASPGAAVESDAELRQRQAISTMNPSMSLFEGLWGSIADLEGVLRVRGYENDTPSTNTLGLPEHSIAFVVDGGDEDAIAQTIATKKSPGVSTHGTTAIVVTDQFGVQRTIRFSRPEPVPVSYRVTLKAKSGYTTSTENLIKQAMVDFTTQKEIGEGIVLAETYVPAQLNGSIERRKFEIQSVEMARDADPLSDSDIEVAYNEAVTSEIADVEVVVVP